MDNYTRDYLAKEQGYIICPLSHSTYVHCDENCENCDLYIDFVESVKEKNKE